MKFRKHSNLEGCHAFLSASTHSWINYDDKKLADYYRSMKMKEEGTELHDIACRLIRKGITLEQSTKTLNQYVNDAIGFHMTPEQILYYSEWCFGTADAISFRKGELRIHDLKTGRTRVSMDQLMIYAALFCLEYQVKPSEIDDICLRIYKSNEIIEHHPGADEIVPIMDKIVRFDKILQGLGED